MNSLKLLFSAALLASLVACSNTPNKDGKDANGQSAEDAAIAEQEARAAEQAGSGLEKTAENVDADVQVSGADGVSPSGLDGQTLEGSNLAADNNETTPSDLDKVYEPVIYFGYDEFSTGDEALAIVKHYATILVDNPSEQIRLVGHTDERGTPEYNLALGERRAKAVAEAFNLYGVNQNRIEVITLGEEQPNVDESTEAAWAQNRRVEILVK